jgi:hypothetical protein
MYHGALTGVEQCEPVYHGALTGVEAFNSLASQVEALQDDIKTHTESRDARLSQRLSEVYELRLDVAQAGRVAAMVVRNFTESDERFRSTLNKHESAFDQILKQAEDDGAPEDRLHGKAGAPEYRIPEVPILTEAESLQIRQNAALEANRRTELAKRSLKLASVSWHCELYQMQGMSELFDKAETLLETSVDLTDARELFLKAAEAQQIIQGLEEKCAMRLQTEPEGTYAMGSLKKLKEANRDIRDVIAHRNQAYTDDPTDRDLYLKHFRQAFDTSSYTSDLHSQLLLAYHKAQESAVFISNNDKAAINRDGKKRKRRERLQNLEHLLERIPEEDEVVELPPPFPLNADAPEFKPEFPQMGDINTQSRNVAHQCIRGLGILSPVGTGSLTSSPCTSPRGA